MRHREVQNPQAKKIKLLLTESINLAKYATNPDHSLTTEHVDRKEFEDWYEREEFRKQDAEDRSRCIWPLESKVVLEDFRLLKMLGKGGFGKVILVENIHDGKQYAMKILRKTDIIEGEQVEHTKAEKTILQHINHPFLVGLHCAFVNKRKIYFVMELMRGGELYCHLGKTRQFNEHQVKFIVACIALALGHLHKHNFIYRDLKLENILLDDKGYVKLTDFGLAKFVRKEDKTHTICGTIFYLAPEVVTQEGHSQPADWWSLGILTYELLHGFPPFYSKNDRQLMKMICSGKFVFADKFPVSSLCQDFIKKVAP